MICWNDFGIKGESKNDSFQEMCMHIFCRKLQVEVDEDFNQKGIEVQPVLSNGKYYSFQCKFFQGRFDWEQVKKSIQKTLTSNDYPDLDVIYIYSNKLPTKSKVREGISSLAAEHGVIVEYKAKTHLETLLQKPEYQDIALHYFNTVDFAGYTKDSVELKKETFLQSRKYMDLTVCSSSCKGDKIDLPEDIINSTNSCHIFFGAPGSGKTYLMYKLFRDLATKCRPLQASKKTSGIPTIIYLRDCVGDSLENNCQE